MSEHPDQHSAETEHATRAENKPNLLIDTVSEPISPGKVENGSAILLSPKTSSAQRILGQQSPSVLKNKLDVLKNLYNKHQDQYNNLIEAEKSFNTKKQHLQNLKVDLANAQKHESEKSIEASQKVPQKQKTIAELEQQLFNNFRRLQHLKSQNLQAIHADRVNQLKAQISSAQQKIADQENASKNSGDQLLNNKIQQKVHELTQKLTQAQQRKSQAEHAITETKGKVDLTKSSISSFVTKLGSVAGGNNSAKLNELQQKKKNIEKQIQAKRQELNKLKSSPGTNKGEGASEAVSLPDLTPLKNEVEEAKKNKARVEKQLESAQKQSKDVASKIKSTETAIEKTKSKNNQLNEKTKKLEEQRGQLQKDIAGNNKKPKYQEKVPEQLIQLRNKKAALEKQAKEEAEKAEKQNNKADDLVPSSIIQKMQAKIKGVHEKNQIWAQLVAKNATLVEENKKLDASKEELEWETNPEVKNADTAKQKEEGKCHSLEEQVSELRKKNIQLTTKVEEYANEYPDFKIDKKLKKAEPAPQPLPAKTQAPVPENKNNNNNNKKKNKSNEQVPVPVQVVEEQEQKPVPPVQKTASKKEDQKGAKNKNKSPKAKQQEFEAPKKEEAPKKKEEVPKKVEAPKKQEAQKKEEAPKKVEPKKETAQKPEPAPTQVEIKNEAKATKEEKAQQGGQQGKNKNKKK